MVNEAFMQLDVGDFRVAEKPASLGVCSVIKWVVFLTGVSFNQGLLASCRRANQFRSVFCD